MYSFSISSYRNRTHCNCFYSDVVLVKPCKTDVNFFLEKFPFCQVEHAMKDLRDSGVDVVTFGQYGSSICEYNDELLLIDIYNRRSTI